MDNALQLKLNSDMRDACGSGDTRKIKRISKQNVPIIYHILIDQNHLESLKELIEDKYLVVNNRMLTHVLHSMNFENSIKAFDFLLEKDITSLEISKLMCSSLIVGKYNLALYFLSKGADINYSEEFILRHALMSQKIDKIKDLIDQGANIHALNNKPWYLALKNSDIEVIKYLIEKYPSLKEADNIFTSVSANRLDLAKYFIEIGCKVKEEDHETIQAAIFSNDLELIEGLVTKAGQNIDIVLSSEYSDPKTLNWAKKYKNFNDLKQALSNDKKADRKLKI